MHNRISLIVFLLLCFGLVDSSSAQLRRSLRQPRSNAQTPGALKIPAKVKAGDEGKVLSQKVTVKLEPVWKHFHIKGVDVSMRGLHVLDDDVIWASGAEGTVLRSMNGGDTWKVYRIPGAEKLDFRDIHAMDEGTATVVSAGAPARFYQTTDGGASWHIAFEHPDKAAFFDALSFWTDERGIAMSDPINGRLLLAKTKDGGRSWQQLSNAESPQTLPGEAGFAASGTGMQILPSGRLLIALGGAEKGKRHAVSRILTSDDECKTWRAARVPMIRSESEGIFSLGFLDNKIGVAVGGDYKRPDSVESNAAFTTDGGATWKKPAPGKSVTGYRSGVALWRKGAKGREINFIAVGTNGTDISTDLGQSWRRVSEEGFNAIQFSPSGKSGWAVGADGRIGRWIQ